MPLATRVPMTEPADVPTMYSAFAALQPVSDSSASSAPISHDAPTTPPAPRTMPTRIRTDSDLGNFLQTWASGSSHTEARFADRRPPYPVVRTSNLQRRRTGAFPRPKDGVRA